MNKMTISNAHICRIEDNKVRPVFGDLHINDGKIEKINPKNFQHFLENPNRVNQSAINAYGRVITIPNTNFHEHIYSRLAKGLPNIGVMNSFQKILHNLWWRVDKKLDLDMVKASARMAALESIRNGVTYIFDHHASNSAVKNSLTEISNVLSAYGLRGVLSFEISDRNGAEVSRENMEENINLVENVTNSHFKGMLGLHASFTLSDDTLAEASELIEKYNLGIHIHLCEDETDNKISLEVAQNKPLRRLTEFNLLNEKSILVHGVHLSQEDLQLIPQYGSAITLNPDSNMNNAVGLPDYQRIPQDIPILVGTDGMHANPVHSFKQLFLLNRNQKNSFEDTFSWMNKIYNDQLYFVKTYFPDFTNLQEGDNADFILWDYVPPTPLTEENFLGHYIYGISERHVKSVVMRGEFLMQDYKIQVMEEDSENLKNYLQGEKLYNLFAQDEK